MARLWARGCVRAAGCRLNVRGAENLRKIPVAVYASNHTSYMDTPVIFAALPFQFRILAKKELWRMALHRLVSEPLRADSNRHRKPSRHAFQLGGGVQALRAGMPLFVFPEGGRTRTGELRRSSPARAYLAITAQVPLVPIALRGVRSAADTHPPFLPSRN